MAIKRAELHETFMLKMRVDFGGAVRNVIPAGHTIGTPEPIFREIKEVEGEGWKKKFGGEWFNE